MTLLNDIAYRTADRALVIYLFLQFFKFFWAQQPPVGQGLLIPEVLRSHTDAPQSIGLLWTSDQPDAETTT